MFSLANNLGIKFYLKNQSFKCIAYLSYHITAHHIHCHWAWSRLVMLNSMTMKSSNFMSDTRMC